MFQEIARWVLDSEIKRFLGDGWDGGKGFFMSDAQDQKFKDCVRTLLPKIDSLVGSMVTINVWWRDPVRYGRN